MKVWIGYDCCYNGCDSWRNTEKVFDCEEKALVWQEEITPTEYDWREYEEYEVE